MNVLIVYAHPEPRSFEGALKDAAVDVLRSGRHQVRVSDLYGMKFEAAGGAHDFLALRDAGFFRYPEEQKHAFATDGFVPQLAEEIEKVAWADLLILHFPLWWFSLPAILKGWVDRVFAAGFAYDPGGAGLLQGKRAMVAITTGDGPRAPGAAGSGSSLDRILFHIHFRVLHAVGCEVLAPFVVDDPAGRSQVERAASLEAYRRRLSGVCDELPLALHAEGYGA